MTDEEIRKIAEIEVARYYDEHGLAKNKLYARDVAAQQVTLINAVRNFKAAGYAVVPVEPTEAMLSAGDSAIPRAEPDYETGIRMMGREVALECYRAMLRAVTEKEAP